MEKKDIYEHLAKIYLDASSDKKDKKKPRRYKPLYFLIAFLSVISTASLGLFVNGLIKQRGNPPESELALFLSSEAIKINFNFDPAVKETFALALKYSDLSRFDFLEFTARKNDAQNAISMRVEFNSAFHESSEIYINNLSCGWQVYRVNLKKFKAIHDWTTMSTLFFTIEKWNTSKKNGVVYIDDIKLIRRTN